MTAGAPREQEPADGRSPRGPAAGGPAPGALLPGGLLATDEMHEACATRDIGAIFRLARDEAGFSHSRLGRLCDMTPSRVGSYAKGSTRALQQHVIERVADGLRIPGAMLGLARRPWEFPREQSRGQGQGQGQSREHSPTP